MKRASLVSNRSLLIAALFSFSLLPFNATGQQTDLIDNSAVIDMVRAGIGDVVIIPKIRSSKVFLDASESALLEMKAAGVSDEAIVTMMERSAVNGSMANISRANMIEIPGGAEVKVVTKEKISGKKVVVGQTLTLETEQDVIVAGSTIIEKGSPVRAIVYDAKKPGRIGRSGRLSVRIEAAKTVDGSEIKLRSAKSGKGGDNFGTALTLSIFWGAGLLIPGKNAEIKAGTIITAYTDESKFVVLNK